MKILEIMKANPSKRITAVLLALLSISALQAQKVVQTIKGTVYDKQSKVTLPGATVYISNTNPVQGTVTDENGNFRIGNV